MMIVVLVLEQLPHMALDEGFHCLAPFALVAGASPAHVTRATMHIAQHHRVDAALAVRKTTPRAKVELPHLRQIWTILIQAEKGHVGVLHGYRVFPDHPLRGYQAVDRDAEHICSPPECEKAGAPRRVSGGSWLHISHLQSMVRHGDQLPDEFVHLVEMRRLRRPACGCRTVAHTI